MPTTAPDLPLFGYPRVSKMGKRKLEDPEFHAVDDQKGEIERWAHQHGRRVVMLEPELDGKGNNPDRPILRRAIDGVRAGEAAGIVTAYLSRGGRDLSMMLDVWNEVEDVAGGEFWSARENLDGKTRSGRLTRNILMSVYQDELEAKRDDFANLREWCVKYGIWRQRKIPFGYRKDWDKSNGDTYRRLVPHEEDAKRLCQGARDVLAGVPVLTVATRLGMTASGLRQRLRNRVSLGELVDGQYENLKAYTPIMSVELFEAVVAKLDDNPRPSRGDKNAAPALLNRRVVCSTCGQPMTRKTTTESMYSCEWEVRYEGEKHKCPGPASITVARLDAYVEPIILAELERISVEARETGRGVDQAEREVEAARGEVKALLKTVTAVGLAEHDYIGELRERKAAQTAAEERLRMERARTPILPAAGTGAKMWEELSGHEHNALARALLAGVVVRRGVRGKRVPLDDRVRVIAHGANVEFVPFPHLDVPGVLRPFGSQNPS